MKKSPFHLQSKFKPAGDQPQAIKVLTKKFKTKSKEEVLLGVTGSGKTFTMANIIQNLGKKTLILAPNKTLAAQLYAEFRDFFPDNAVEYFVSYYDYYQPEAYVLSSDTYIEKDSSVNDEIDKLRHSATRNLLEREDVIVVASVSCIYGIGSPDEYESQKVSLFVGEEIERDDLLKSLVNMQYERNDIDFSRGCFRVRGDMVEVFPSYEESNVIRIEFFGDEIESLHVVDPLRGLIIKSLHKVSIYPKSHYVVSEERMQKAIATIKVELRQRLQFLEKENQLVEKQRLEQRTLLDIEIYSRHLTGAKAGDPPPTLIDFFYKDFLLIVDESHIALPQVGGMYKGDRSRKENLVNFGFRLPSALDNRPLQFTEFEDKCDQVLYVSATPGNFELEKTGGEFVEQIIRPTGLLDPVIEVRDATNQIDDLVLEAKKVIECGFRVLVTTLTKKMAEEVTNYFTSLSLRVRYLHSDIDTIERMEIIRDLRLGVFDILVGINLLREGLDLPEVALVAILDADKEGFLRSERSLIQTIGRAARNEEGRVILYAYKETKSMHKAMSETKRRREVQEKFNQEHGISPKTIIKAVSGGVIETLRGTKGKREKGIEVELSDLNPRSIEEKIKELKVEMKLLAKELKFEEAAAMRDEIKVLQEARLLL
jgi:excinuclease ABC subunit B